MKKLILVSIVLFAAAIWARGQVDDYVLDQFKDVSSFVDQSLDNQFDETLFCKDWYLSAVWYETYVDGELVSSRRDGDWGKSNVIMRKDHYMFFGRSTGYWLYAHNHLMWKYTGNFIANEVVDLTDSKMVLRHEDYPLGGVCTPSFKDKSGKHCFYVFEYSCLEGA